MPNYSFCKKKKKKVMSTKQSDLVVLHLVQSAEQDLACPPEFREDPT